MRGVLLATTYILEFSKGLFKLNYQKGRNAARRIPPSIALFLLWRCDAMRAVVKTALKSRSLGVEQYVCAQCVGRAFDYNRALRETPVSCEHVDMKKKTRWNFFKEW